MTGVIPEGTEQDPDGFQALTTFVIAMETNPSFPKTLSLNFKPFKNVLRGIMFKETCRQGLAPFCWAVIASHPQDDLQSLGHETKQVYGKYSKQCRVLWSFRFLRAALKKLYRFPRGQFNCYTSKKGEAALWSV